MVDNARYQNIMDTFMTAVEQATSAFEEELKQHTELLEELRLKHALDTPAEPRKASATAEQFSAPGKKNQAPPIFDET